MSFDLLPEVLHPVLATSHTTTTVTMTYKFKLLKASITPHHLLYLSQELLMTKTILSKASPLPHLLDFEAQTVPEAGEAY
jgi:hypothetical protein